jgi:NADH-quinone oxidoreductase subunit M
MTDSFLLTLTIFLPLIGAGAMWVTAPAGRDTVRYTALSFAILTLLVAAYLVSGFPLTQTPDAFALSNSPWLTDSSFDIRWHIGLDGLGVWMFGLAALLFVTAILVSWEAIKDREPLFYAMLLLLEFGCLGVFSARDLVLFYIFFEFTLIPLFFLIGIWGSEDRRYAAIKFFLYTLAGSVLTFLGLLTIVLWDFQHAGEGVMRFSIPDLQASLMAHPLPTTWQWWIFLALFAGFAIKVPLFPVHTWLPLAHVQAPTAGSVILAGVLLKIGVYGFVRFNMAMLPDATLSCAPWILWLSVAGIVYGALVALAQTDMKRLIAYSSVSHLGYCMLGIFSLTPLGLNGGLLQMVNHGISTGGLFAIVGMLYERYHTREIKSFGGLAYKMPLLTIFMLIFTFSSIGLPGMNGFVGEFMILLGMFQRAWQGVDGLSMVQGLLIAVLSVSGVVLGAWYMLQLVQNVFFGPLREPSEEGHAQDHHEVSDLNFREFFALAPLVVFVLWIGIRPHDFLPALEQPVRSVITSSEDAAKKRAILGSTVSPNSIQSTSSQEFARVR